MKVIALSLMLILAGCAHVNELEKPFVGQWTWDFASTDGKCFDTGGLSLRSDGTHSQSSEGGCETIIASDSFGRPRLGWYAVKNMVCITNDEEEMKLRVLTEACKNYGYRISINASGELVLVRQITFGGVTQYVELSNN